MELTCPQCARLLQYVGEPPAFCGYCGKPLAAPAPGTTAAYVPAGETTAAAADAGSAPEVVGGYRLLRPLGVGGMGKVYEAEDGTSGRHVALKLIAAEHAASADAVERFRQEGRLASAIAHPRCVFVLAADEDAGRPYIVMELMPGSTLKDLVDRCGPLPPDEAVQRILDVIEGLEEAHQLGVVHRDVKPSNCFLDSENRVKVGDFGLSKSLLSSSQLTRTGAFLGTPLYASPEQIRCEVVDQQSDVYSVAATLYFLLTGKAPFESGDAAATMARIVADPTPSVRAVRPEVSRALERVVLRGLARQREQRYRSLAEMRAALLPLAPDRLSIGGMGVRFGAYVIDYLLLIVMTAVVNLLLPLLRTDGAGAFTLLVGPAVWVLYFGICEGKWGCSVGKRLLGLRVCPRSGGQPPGPPRALLRALVFYVLDHLGSIFVFSFFLFAGLQVANQAAVLAVLWLFYPLEALGVGLMMSTMRARNGYRGLHEFISGTRVVALPAPERRPRAPVRREPEPARRPGLPERLGPFLVQGVLREQDGEQVLLGEDVILRRRALLWLRPPAAPPLPPGRPEVKRRTRLRWLTGGTQTGTAWDAFFAPRGCSLTDFMAAGPRLPWAEARPLLEQLTDELAAGCADGTLPRAPTLAHVWVQAEGRLQILDTPLTAGTPEAGQSVPATTLPERCLTLLRQTAVLLLEGHTRPPDDRTTEIRAPLPPHAGSMLHKLLAGAPTCADVGQFQADLGATREQPVEVTRPRRVAHLLLLTVLLFGGLSFGMLPASSWPSIQVATVTLTAIREGEQAVRDLEAAAASTLVSAVLTVKPPLLLTAAESAAVDLRQRARLQELLIRMRRTRAAEMAALAPFARAVVVVVDSPPVPGGQRPKLRSASAEFRKTARDLLEGRDPVAEETEGMHLFPLVVLLFWPVLWIVWAFLLRGGLSFRMLGMALVRHQGRKAGRWQCAWRALLVWAPVTALLALSVELERLYWWGQGDGPMRDPALLSLSSGAWWSAVGLLMGYVVLAIWLPQRSVHDRLAGTYLVPR